MPMSFKSKDGRGNLSRSHQSDPPPICCTLTRPGPSRVAVDIQADGRCEAVLIRGIFECEKNFPKMTSEDEFQTAIDMIWHIPL